MQVAQAGKRPDQVGDALRHKRAQAAPQRVRGNAVQQRRLAAPQRAERPRDVAELLLFEPGQRRLRGAAAWASRGIRARCGCEEAWSLLSPWLTWAAAPTAALRGHIQHKQCPHGHPVQSSHSAGQCGNPCGRRCHAHAGA